MYNSCYLVILYTIKIVWGVVFPDQCLRFALQPKRQNRVIVYFVQNACMNVLTPTVCSRNSKRHLKVCQNKMDVFVFMPVENEAF